MSGLFENFDLYNSFFYIIDWIKGIGQTFSAFWFSSFTIFNYTMTLGDLVVTLFPIFIVLFLVKKFVPLT